MPILACQSVRLSVRRKKEDVPSVTQEGAGALIPQGLIDRHAEAGYAMRMRTPGNASWLTGLELMGLVKTIAAQGLGNLEVRAYVEQPGRVFLNLVQAFCSGIKSTTPPLILRLLHCAFTAEGKAAGVRNHWLTHNTLPTLMHDPTHTHRAHILPIIVQFPCVCAAYPDVG